MGGQTRIGMRIHCSAEGHLGLQILFACNRGKTHLNHIWLGQEYDYVVLLGGTIPQEQRYEYAEVYSITGQGDDHYIAQLLSDKTIFIESRIVYLHDNWYIAGIGGRDPIANINAVKRQLNEIKPAGTRIIVASYFCPYGLCDMSRLGTRRGLHELRELLFNKAVKVMASCDCGPGVLRLEDKMLLCLMRGKCIASLRINNKYIDAVINCQGHGHADNPSRSL